MQDRATSPGSPFSFIASRGPNCTLCQNRKSRGFNHGLRIIRINIHSGLQEEGGIECRGPTRRAFPAPAQQIPHDVPEFLNKMQIHCARPAAARPRHAPSHRKAAHLACQVHQPAHRGQTTEHSPRRSVPPRGQRHVSSSSMPTATSGFSPCSVQRCR